MRHLRDLLLLVPLAACYAFIGWQNPGLAPQLPLFFGFMLVFVLLPALGLGGLLVRLPLSLAERRALGSPATLAMLFALAYAGAALRRPLRRRPCSRSVRLAQQMRCAGGMTSSCCQAARKHAQQERIASWC